MQACSGADSACHPPSLKAGAQEEEDQGGGQQGKLRAKLHFFFTSFMSQECGVDLAVCVFSAGKGVGWGLSSAPVCDSVSL